MEISRVDQLAALAHPHRLDLFRLLVRRYPQAVTPGELAEALDLRHNTLSTYLASLRSAGLVTQERAGRFLLYRADIAAADGLMSHLVGDCCRGRVTTADPAAVALDRQSPLRVLFLCTGNSARSVIAETLLRALGGSAFRAVSAGTRPAAAIHPLARQVLTEHGHDPAGLSPKPVSALQGQSFDVAITVCDRAANEPCARWPGLPVQSHWGLPDPADSDDPARFRDVYDRLHRAISGLVPFARGSFSRQPYSAGRRRRRYCGRVGCGQGRKCRLRRRYRKTASPARAWRYRRQRRARG